MALATRQELERSIADWLNREDAGTIERIPDFITLAENRIFRSLRCKSNEAYTQVADIADVNFVVPVPSDLVEVKYMAIPANAGLTPKSEQAYYAAQARVSQTTWNAVTQYYTRLKTTTDNYYIWPQQAGLSAPLDLYYYNKQKLGTQVGATTQVLVDAPGLYLFGSLLEAAPFLKYPENIAVWQAKFDQDFDELMGNTWASEYAGGTPTVSEVYGD